MIFRGFSVFLFWYRDKTGDIKSRREVTYIEEVKAWQGYLIANNIPVILEEAGIHIVGPKSFVWMNIKYLFFDPCIKILKKLVVLFYGHISLTLSISISPS